MLSKKIVIFLSICRTLLVYSFTPLAASRWSLETWWFVCLFIQAFHWRKIKMNAKWFVYPTLNFRLFLRFAGLSRLLSRKFVLTIVFLAERSYRSCVIWFLISRGFFFFVLPSNRTFTSEIKRLAFLWAIVRLFTEFYFCGVITLPGLNCYNFERHGCHAELC